MWIIPSQMRKQYSVSVLEASELKGASRELVHNSKLRLTWKSKPLSSQTLSQVWKRAWWLRHLFGQILRPSDQLLFETKYTASLPVIPASLSVTQGYEKEQTTLDTCGCILKGLSVQQDLFGASSKTLKDTCLSGSMKFTKAFTAWVTMLRQDYTQRKKLARHIKEKDYSSSRWPTPAARDFRDGKSNITYNSRPLNEVVLFPSGQLTQGQANTNGKNQGQLNPAWVAQLMGTTLEKTFFVCTEMGSYNKPQHLPGKTYGKK